MSDQDLKAFPQALELERALLGGLIWRPDKLQEIGLVVEPTDFYRPDHAALYELLRDMQRRGHAIDGATVAERVARAPKGGQEFGGVGYVVELPEQCPSTANLGYYAEQVLDRAQRRAALRTLQDAAEAVHDPVEGAGEVLDRVLRQVNDAANRHGRRDEGDLVDIATELDMDYADAAEVVAQQGEGPRLRTGLGVLDNLVLMSPGDLVVLHAITSHGKTALALQIATNVVLDATMGGPVLIISLEMPRKDLGRRIFGNRSRVALRRHKLGQLTDDEADRWAAAVRHFEDRAAPLKIIDRSGLTIHDVQARARLYDRQLREQGWADGLQLVVVDYLQRMHATDHRMTRRDAVTEMSGGLKDLAVELDTVVLELAQPNRMSQGGADQRPKAWHLAESSAIEKDADTILAAYWHAKTVAESERADWRHHYELEVQKQRVGPAPVRMLLHFEAEFGRYRDLTPHELRTWNKPPANPHVPTTPFRDTETRKGGR